MASFDIEYNIGEDLVVYKRLLDQLPKGQDNLNQGLVLPSNTTLTPLSLLIKNVKPNIPHILYVTAENGTPPVQQIGFVPTSTSFPITIPLLKGVNTIFIIDNTGFRTRFSVSVTHYALLFRAHAREINEHSIIPLDRVEANITSSIGYVLAAPLIADVNKFIPTDLEILGTLSNKLLVKNLLFRPGTTPAVIEILTAFGASHPVFNPMKNIGIPETPLYRPEEHFSGFEAHMWLPNREVERWKAFSIFLNNLPQLYSIQQITEGEIYVKVGDRIHRHNFDFESDFANTVLEGGAGDDCFNRLFRLDISSEGEMFIGFCQASYFMDSVLPAPGLETPDTDLLGVTNFQDWTLTGRMDQQWDHSYGAHEWHYDSPLFGVVDGNNRYFDLAFDPNSARAVKILIDGLLLRLNLDYRISVGSDFRSGVYQLPNSMSPILIDAGVGDPRPFLGPSFSSIEIVGSGDAQYLVTATNQTLTSLSFVISHPPSAPASDEEGRLHYTSPALLAPNYAGDNQYGTETLVIGSTAHIITFPTPLLNVDYQLIVQYAEDPAGTPTSVSQLHSIVRNHTLTTAVVEFSEAVVSPNAKLHWWAIEEDSVALERGTITLTSSISDILLAFTAGPYLDQVVLILQLWNTTGVGSVDLPLVSFTNLNQFSAKVLFSHEIPDGNYRLDYIIFPSQAGNLVEIFAPPGSTQLVEAHYDVEWTHWENAGPLEPVDGLKNTFTLYSPCPIPEAMYATLDGRLLTQGLDQQYVLDGPTHVRLNFTPEFGQKLWFVYPIADLGGNPPDSSWYQGFLARQADTTGALATGFVTNASTIDDGNTLTISGETFTAKNTARGSISNTTRILVGDAVTFVEEGITLIGAPFLALPTTGVAETTSINVIGDFAGSLNSTFFLIDSPTTSYYVWFNVGGVGVDPAVFGRTAVEVALNTNDAATQVAVALSSALDSLSDFTSSPQVATVQVACTQVGDVLNTTDGGNPTSFSFVVGIDGSDPTYTPFEFAVGVDRDTDALSLVSKINSEPTLNLKYLAVYEGDGLTSVRAKALGGSAYNQTLTEVGSTLTVSSIIGDTTTTQDEVQQIDFSAVPNLGKFNLAFGGYVTADIDASASAAQVAAALNAIPTVQDASVSGDFFTGFTVTFTGTDGSKDHPLLEVAGPDLLFSPAEVDVLPNTLTLVNHGFFEAQSLGFRTTGTLPSPLTQGTTYYVHIIDANTIEVTATPGGVIVDLVDGGTGFHRALRNNLMDGSTAVEITISETTPGFGNYFGSGVSQAFDSQALTNALNNSAVVNKLYTAAYVPGTVTITAKTAGTPFNQPILLSGTSLNTTDLIGGVDPKYDLPMVAFKPAYYRDAPVIALDGVSTRLYDIYSGNSVKFDTKPVALQEPYFISEVFPVDHHPMDSMVANQPCSYPKGAFAQGLSAQLTDIEFDVEQEGLLNIFIDNLPIQEAPVGAIDGVNVTYDLTFNSCAGKDSMMLFIDGIFQPPTTFAYSTFSGHGRIVLSAALVPPQKLWIWYLPTGDACVEEHVVELTGVIDNFNQNFGVPDSPFVNRSALVVFLQGLFNLQDVDYTVDLGNTSITYSGALAPAVGQSLWGHFNNGNIGFETWRQLQIGVGDGVTATFLIPTLITGDLPTSQDSILLALDGLMQREGVDFTVNLGLDSFPDGNITFTGGAPELGRKIQVAYIRRG